MTNPIKVWLIPSGPNPWKVVLILNELNVPYEIVSFKFEDVKKKPFIDINPNGRVPAIVDPNTNLTIWESGAIIQYLVEVYDPEKKLTYDNTQKHLLNQWLHFQMSGQGPYYGQLGWFGTLTGEKNTAAIERYEDQVSRVLTVMNTYLEGKEWLVGDKLPPGEDPLKAYPNVKAWHQRMESRDSWQKAMETRAKLMDEQGLQPNGMPKGVNNIQEYEEWLAKSQAAEGKC